METAMNFVLYERGLDAREMQEKVGRLSMYASDVTDNDSTLTFEVPK